MIATPPVQMQQYSLYASYLDCIPGTFVTTAGWQIQGDVGWTGRMNQSYYTNLTVANPTSTEQFNLFPTFIYSTPSIPMAAGGMSDVRPLADPLHCVPELIIHGAGRQSASTSCWRMSGYRTSPRSPIAPTYYACRYSVPTPLASRSRTPCRQS